MNFACVGELDRIKNYIGTLSRIVEETKGYGRVISMMQLPKVSADALSHSSGDKDSC